MAASLRRNSILPIVLLGCAAFGLPAVGQEVYTGNGSNGRILRLDFVAGTTTTVNTDVGGKKFRGLALRDDGPGSIQLIIGERQTSALLFYDNADGAGEVITLDIPSPDGPSVDFDGDLYVVSTPSESGGEVPAVWKLEKTDCEGCVGGYGPPSVLDNATGSSALVDTLVVRNPVGGLAAGDLLVLSKKPARVLRYPGGSGPAQILINTSAFPAKTQPTGFAFTPAGELLVAATSGQVLRFTHSGSWTLQSQRFASGLGKGIYKLAAGVQAGVPRVFIASRHAGSVVRYRIELNGTGTPDGALAGDIQTPNGVAITPNASVFTPAGLNVTIQALPEVELTFEKVTQDGFTTSELIEFEDNRGEGGSQSLRDFFDEGSPFRTSLPDVMVPDYVKALPKGGPEGPPTFLLARIDTTAPFEGITEYHGLEDVRLGWDPACPNDTEPDQEPRTFYTPELPKGEPGLQEGEIFTDVSTQCGSNRGGGWSFSLYLTGRDTRSVSDIAFAKFDEIEAAVEGNLRPFIDDTLFHFLIVHGEIDEAREAFNEFVLFGDPEDQEEASNELGDVIRAVRNRLVRGVPITIDDSVRNVSGEIVARCLSAKFFVCKGASDFEACLAE